MEFFNYKLTDKDKEYCSVHAKKMAEGFSTYSFKNDEKQSLDVYNIGKIGEFAFFKFLSKLERKDKLKIKHVPFRENYDKLNFKDDYIIEVGGKEVQIEVRTKGRNVGPELEYECCTDCIKPHFVYVFISFNKQTDVVSVLGYANWDNFKNHAEVTLKGNTNSNFKNKVNEFNIKIKFLNEINDIVNLK
jgi:hypothetical protein